MMSLTSPVSCVSGDFSFYPIVCFLICYMCCYRTNHILWMTSLKNLGLTPDPLVHTLFALFLCVLARPLVVLVFWGLTFLHQQESIPKVIFFLPKIHTDRSQVQRWSTHQNVLALKFLIFSPYFKISLIVIVKVRICLTHSNRCIFNKDIIRHAPMGTICRP